ncbi:MAG: glutamine amidotransferase-related protein [Rhodoferax sp.]
MKLCILDNDNLDAHLAPSYHSFGSMFIRLFDSVGANWTVDVFKTTRGEYPERFDDYQAVLLTGSHADAFSDLPWVVELRRRVSELLAQRKKLVGVCFGHQLIALCLGARVQRAAQGWGVGRQRYDWHRSDLPHFEGRSEVALLASHQDQVLELPPGARLVASNDFCPVAAFTLDKHVFCIQPHPEFVEDVSAYLLEKRRNLLGEPLYSKARNSLQLGHEGQTIARLLVSFIEATDH